jgi:small subunit ribosomal protein S9
MEHCVSDQSTTPESKTPGAPATPAEAAFQPTTPDLANVAAAAPASPTPSSAPGSAAPSANKGGDWFLGTGRRKTAVARIRLRVGTGQFLIHKRKIDDYFFSEQTRLDVIAPLKATQAMGKFDIFVNVRGGGQIGQAGAISLGVARALMKADPNLESVLRDGKYLTRDSRKVERKKPGQPGARKRFQFSKR